MLEGDKWVRGIPSPFESIVYRPGDIRRLPPPTW